MTLESSKHTFRLTNSFGAFDFHYYSTGWRGNQYVRTTKVAKIAPFFKTISKAAFGYSVINSYNNLINASTDREIAVHSLDLFMDGVGLIKHPATIGLSLYWSLGGKELF